MGTIEFAKSRGLTIALEDSEKCPNCGGNCWDVFYVEEWGRSYCDECLDREIEKFTLPYDTPA
jgi:reverse gyrase